MGNIEKGNIEKGRLLPKQAPLFIMLNLKHTYAPLSASVPLKHVPEP